MFIGSGMRYITLGSMVALLGAAAGLVIPEDGAELHTIVEYIRPGGSCASPTGTNDISLAEAYRLPAAGLTYRINLDSAPKGLDKTVVASAINNAAAAWNSAGAPALSYGGVTSKKAGGRVADGVNTISFGSAPQGSIAVALVWVRNGEVFEADMSLGNGFKWDTNGAASGDCGGAAGKMDVGNIAAHELGHWVGAQHTPADAAYNHRTMYPYASYQELYKRSLAAGDGASIPAQP
ncbi:MAG: hypothetical protein HYY02_02850 [Chloroflexi bacterium]|nr:hypothetical protein [Chloroflexota bacterium]